MKNVSEHVPYENCCGCGACANTCSKGAISMVENHEGFLVPQVDTSACIDCGLCLKACPALQDKRENDHKPDCYAAQAADNIRAISSSGGIFTPLAEAILNRGGFVCGAAFRNDWTVHHIIIDKKEDLDKLRRSKYVQSDTEDCYKRIKTLLKDGKWVLFSGTPCQVAGLYTYLGKDYDTLLTVDIFCHGAPSPGVWKRYLRENYEPGSIANINFRDKTAIGWSCSHVAITLKNGKKEVSDNYTKWFHSSVILRPSCQDCKYSKIPRPADISLGDWWGISQVNATLNDGKGLTNVLINSQKGKDFFASINLPVLHKIDLPEHYNNANLRYGKKHSLYRNDFFISNMPMNTQKESRNAVKDKHYDICYIGNHYSKNYGSMLVHYACIKLLELTGVSILVLDRPLTIFRDGHEEQQNIISNAFARRHYKNISCQYEDIDDLARTNDICDGYVVGSDQMFNLVLNMDSLVYLQFAREDKLKIAFGTSFGHDSYRAHYERLLKNKILLQRFNHIALREIPHNVVHNFLELKADRIIDPTLILPHEYYHALADTAETVNTKDPYVLTYVLDFDKNKEAVILHIANKLGLRIINIPNANIRERKPTSPAIQYERNYTPEEFLRLYKDATFVITDSYHGSCFSIIFRKDFISLVNKSRGLLRYQMFYDMGLKKRFYSDVSDIYKSEDWKKPVDYSIANTHLTEGRSYARLWLARSLRKLIWKKKMLRAWNIRKKISRWVTPPVRNFFRALRKIAQGK